MKKFFSVLFFVSCMAFTHAYAQIPKDDNLKFSRDFMTCHQLINCALNYNAQPEIYFAFLKEADRYLVTAQSKFNANKVKWGVLIAPLKTEDVDFILEQYQVLTMKDKPLTPSEMQSSILWLRVTETKNRQIVQKIIE